MKENAVRIFSDGKNLRKLFSRGAGINRREAPNQLLNFSTFFAGTRKKERQRRDKQ